jgi:hypothetical protein
MTKTAYSLIVVAALGAMLPSSWALADPSVTVVNPATNPAKTSSVDDPGRIPYQFFKNLQPCVNTTCQATTPPVPDGKRLVVQHVSAFGALTSPGNVVEVVVSTDTAVLSTFAPPVFGNPGTQDLPSTSPSSASPMRASPSPYLSRPTEASTKPHRTLWSPGICSTAR